MTGLDKILQQIQEEAQSAARAAVEEKRREIDEQLKRAEQEGAQRAEAIRRDAELRAQAFYDRAESAAVLEKKRRILAAKQQLISGVLKEARDAIRTMEEGAYFHLLLCMVEQNAQPKEGVMVLSAGDFARMPADFQKEVTARVPAGASLRVTCQNKETPEIDGGFLLMYGGIEENCTFDALFAAAHEDLQDLAQATLFA
jgi:V/A-type H+-transporting ATPase subunit E